MMRVETLERVPVSTAPAVVDFLNGRGPVYDRFPYQPFDQDAFLRRQRHLQESFTGNRQALSEALVAHNRRLGAGPAALENASRLADPRTLAVVTGQQAGVGGGPLFTLFKAVTAIQLAREQSQRLGVPVVPVFWVAAEDHDFAEIAHLQFPGRDRLVRLSLEGAPEGRVSVGHLPTGEPVAELLGALAESLPQTEFTGPLLEQLRADAATAGNLGDWFGRLMASLFRESGLVIISPMWPEIRRLQAPFFQEALRRHQEVDAALAAGIQAWEEAGYTPTLGRHPGDAHLFHYVEGQRLPLAGDGRRLWVRDQPERAWDLNDRLALAAADPERFSTNAVTRTVAQGWVLPDLATVLGPGEIQYWGLLREVFALFGREMPVAYPRTSMTLVEPPMARYLERLGIPVAEVFGGLEERRQQLLAESDPIGLDPLFDQFRAQVEEQHQAVVQQILSLDDTLAQVARENRKQILRQVDILKQKAWQALRRRNQTTLRQLDRLSHSLYPHDRLQERVHTAIYYLAKYGPDLGERLVAAVPLPAEVGGWRHLLVYLT